MPASRLFRFSQPREGYHVEVPRPRLLGVLLSYNDDDFVADAVETMLEQGHDVIVWEHGSNSETKQAWRPYVSELMEYNEIPREFDFYELYPFVSRHIQLNYSDRYDWVSWPDFDEILEGPNRNSPYPEWISQLNESPFDWIEFRNINFWWTTSDDQTITSPLDRVRHYSWFPDCAPRIRSWRMSATNVRIFNHNEPLGRRYPELFNLRHYPMRSENQMMRRIFRDQSGLRRGDANFHYENMAGAHELLRIRPDELHFDDGSEINLDPIFDWRSIYGWAESNRDSSAEPSQ